MSKLFFYALGITWSFQTIETRADMQYGGPLAQVQSVIVVSVTEFQLKQKAASKKKNLQQMLTHWVKLTKSKNKSRLNKMESGDPAAPLTRVAVSDKIWLVW